MAVIDIYGRLHPPKIESLQTESLRDEDRPLMSGTEVKKEALSKRKSNLLSLKKFLPACFLCVSGI